MSMSSAHQDKMERPQYFTFIYKNGDTTSLRNPSDSLLRAINADIESHKKNITEAQLVFRTTEKIVFKYESYKVSTIRMVVNNKEYMIEKNRTNKIPQIFYQSVGVMWDGVEKNAFKSSFFYIQFHTGPEKFFHTYPFVQLKFLDHQLIKSILWKQVNEDYMTYTEL
ncbi:MAG: hypothetical protein JWN78_854 [Bacteroidota bacterium]|nr:hypothetical protein [Bacteroidota bacterium]